MQGDSTSVASLSGLHPELYGLKTWIDEFDMEARQNTRCRPAAQLGLGVKHARELSGASGRLEHRRRHKNVLFVGYSALKCLTHVNFSC